MKKYNKEIDAFKKEYAEASNFFERHFYKTMLVLVIIILSQVLQLCRAQNVSYPTVNGLDAVKRSVFQVNGGGGAYPGIGQAGSRPDNTTAIPGWFRFDSDSAAGGSSGSLIMNVGVAGTPKYVKVLTSLDAVVAGAVASVTATNSTLTISPTTGAVLAGLNLANANTWSATQSIGSGANLNFIGTSSGTVGLYNAAFGNASFADMIDYPQSGTNVSSRWFLTPKGLGNTNDQVRILMSNKDFVADGTNTEFFEFQTATSQYNIFSAAAGSGVIKPITIYTGANSGQLQLKINGGVTFGIYGIGTFSGSPTRYLGSDISGNIVEIPYIPFLSGVFSPTVAASTNCSAATATFASYTKSGANIHVRVTGSVTATASGTDCAFTITLPSGTNGNLFSNLGEGNVNAASAIAASVSASSGTLMIVHFLPTSTSATAYGVSFDYTN